MELHGCMFHVLSKGAANPLYFPDRTALVGGAAVGFEIAPPPRLLTTRSMSIVLLPLAPIKRPRGIVNSLVMTELPPALMSISNVLDSLNARGCAASRLPGMARSWRMLARVSIPSGTGAATLPEAFSSSGVGGKWGVLVSSQSLHTQWLVMFEKYCLP